jgi:hypothetical protein
MNPGTLPRRTAMVITPSPELEAALSEQARRRGITPEVLALNVLRERFLAPTASITPQDEWERRLLGIATDCGVSLPHSALSSEGLYEL